MLEPQGMRRFLAEQHPAASRELRACLDALPKAERDGWLDSVFGVDAFPPEGADLPRGCVPYLPCPVDVVLRALDQASVTHRDVFVDIGSGVGRAVALAHFLTGASAIGLEIQRELAAQARLLAESLNAARVSIVEGDAAELVRHLEVGTVFFLYCPFSGSRLERVLEHLARIARTRSIRVCCVHMPVLERPWLELSAADEELSIYRSRVLKIRE